MGLHRHHSRRPPGSPESQRAEPDRHACQGGCRAELRQSHVVDAVVRSSFLGICDAQTSPDIVRQQISLKRTVETIDHTARTVTIRGDQGNIVTLDIPTSVKRLDQVKVGDIVRVSDYDIVSLRLKPAGEAAVDRTLPPVTATSAEGALPGATTVSQRVTTVTITGWDPATKVVTFTVPTARLTAIVAPTGLVSVTLKVSLDSASESPWTGTLNVFDVVRGECDGPGGFRVVRVCGGGAGGRLINNHGHRLAGGRRKRRGEDHGSGAQLPSVIVALASEIAGKASLLVIVIGV